MRASADDIIEFGAGLPRTDSVVIYGRRKLRVQSLVYVAFSVDEKLMGFAYPRHSRAELVASDPRKFAMPRVSDLRYNWVLARVAELDYAEARELVLDAWGMVVPAFVFRETIENLGEWAPEI